jgi:hypothetical protein
MKDNAIHWIMGAIVLLILILSWAGCLASGGSDGQGWCGTGEYGVSGAEIVEPC